jgi:cardiolipin synthase
MSNVNIEVIVTGNRLVGGGFRSIIATFEELVREAKREIQIAAYSLGGGIESFLQLLDEAASRGIRITLIINRLENQPQGILQKLREMELMYPHVQVIGFTDPLGGDLHSKVAVFDRRKAIVGSANLTWRGMVENHEVAVLLEGEIVSDISQALERLADRHD